MQNTNMSKYCEINLNARYRLNFKYPRDDRYVLVKKIIDFIQHMSWH